jgi:toxin ParE1/3/4
MAQLTWTEPALLDLDEVAEYIVLDDPAVACCYVQKVFDRSEQLESHPQSGKQVEELPGTPYREIVIPPCRVIYRLEKNTVNILCVMRTERLLRQYLIEKRNREK